jgi:arabinose-5-phosphate isomerase
MRPSTSKPRTGQQDSETQALGEPLIASALRTLDLEAGGISALSGALRDGLGRALVAAVHVIQSAKGRLIVSGMGKSGHIARKIAATFASTGTPAFFVHPSEASHGDLGMVTPEDVDAGVVMVGRDGRTEKPDRLFRRFRIPLIAVTAHSESTLGKAADVVLTLPQAREACPHNLAPTTSSLMQLALGDALAIALLESPRLFGNAISMCCIRAGGLARCSNSCAT